MWREKNTEKGKGDRENREKEVEIGENRAPTGGVSAEIGGGEEEQERAALPFQKCLSCRVDFVLFVTGSRNAEQRMPSRGQPFHECAAEQSLKKDMITDNRRGIFLDPKKKKSRSRRPGADTGVVPLFAIHGTPMVCTQLLGTATPVAHPQRTMARLLFVVTAIAPFVGQAFVQHGTLSRVRAVPSAMRMKSSDEVLVDRYLCICTCCGHHVVEQEHVERSSVVLFRVGYISRGYQLYNYVPCVCSVHPTLSAV